MAEYPARPVGCIEPSWFGLDVSDAAWASGAPDMVYMYAVVPYLPTPNEYKDNVDQCQKLTVSRAVSVDATHTYLDNWTWLDSGVGGLSSGYTMLLSASAGDITNTTGWTTRQTQPAEWTEKQKPYYDTGAECGVIEIRAWAGEEERADVFVAAYSVEWVHDAAYTDPGASDVRQHVERVKTTSGNGIEPDRMASAYHAQWCICESLNRCMYEDRYSNVWPVFDPTKGA